MQNDLHYSNFFEDTGIFSPLFESSEYPWQVLGKMKDFFENFKNSPESATYQQIDENIFVGQNVEIDDTARIQDMAIIGHNCTIGHAAYIRAGVFLGENVHVGHATEVKHSIILSKTALAHLNYIGDSIVGSGVNVSGGATLANWRFDKKEIFIKNGETVIPTNLEKLGAILGDDSFIGVNAVLNPGTILARGSLVYPLISVKGVHLTLKTFKE